MLKEIVNGDRDANSAFSLIINWRRKGKFFTLLSLQTLIFMREHHEPRD